MRTDTRTRPVGQVDPARDPARAAAADRLSRVLAPPPTSPDHRTSPAAHSQPPATDIPAAPWATLDPDGDRPERIPPESPDVSAWADPPWWGRIRWAPDKVAGIALVVLVVGLGAFSVHRLLSAVPEGPPVPVLPLATPGQTVPPDGDSAPGPAATDDPGSPAGASAGAADPATVEPDEVVVSVVGLVGRSGLVTLPPGSRVADALDSAGGVLEGGDRDGLNLARKLADGEQILVGLAPGPDGPRGPRSDIIGADGAPAGPQDGQGSQDAGGGAAGPAGGAAADPAQVDINTADATELESLPGVGPVTASAILSWRAANGSFTSVDQLVEVDGIGPATLNRLRPLVTT